MAPQMSRAVLLGPPKGQIGAPKDLSRGPKGVYGFIGTLGPPSQAAMGMKRKVREAPPAGLEPATFGLEVQRAIRLRHEGTRLKP